MCITSTRVPGAIVEISSYGRAVQSSPPSRIEPPPSGWISFTTVPDRPMIVRKMHQGGPELKTGSAHVIGRTGTVVKEIHPDGGGSVRLNGELWTARPYDEVSTIEPGTRVEVMSIDGATAVVYPIGEPLHHELNLPEPTDNPAPNPNPTDPPQS